MTTKIEIATDENWDDIDASKYNPSEDTENRNVLRVINVASRFIRRQFRLSERQRLFKLGKGFNKPEDSSFIKLFSDSKATKIAMEPNPFN